MFCLEDSISDWRSQMRAGGIKSPLLLEELESHLRDEMEHLAGTGLNEQEAFHIAARHIGQANALKSEFAKSKGTLWEVLKRLAPKLAGVPNPQLATYMNTPNSIPHAESRWATYGKATAFLGPATLVWLLCVVCLLPKLQEVCRAAGTTAFQFGEAPALSGFLKAWAALGEIMLFLTAHGFLAGGAIVFAFIFLEWRVRPWPRYRRATVGAGVFLFNFAVLLSITLMVISALLAVSKIMPVK